MWRGLFDRIIRLSAYTNDGLEIGQEQFAPDFFGFLRGNEMSGIGAVMHASRFKTML
jgi:hypothetical protein